MELMVHHPLKLLKAELVFHLPLSHAHQGDTVQPVSHHSCVQLEHCSLQLVRNHFPIVRRAHQDHIVLALDYPLSVVVVAPATTVVVMQLLLRLILLS